MAPPPATVLVTGGAGYIGSHTVLSLLAAGRRAVVLDDLSTGTAAAIPSGVELVEGDIGDSALVRAVLESRGVVAVMHFAGVSIAPQSMHEPLAYYGTNTAKSRCLLEACVAAGVRAFVFSSSAAVYGNCAAQPVTEATPPRPINPYGRSKLMVEMMLEDAAAAHGMATCALRYFNVAGADPAGRAGHRGVAATNLVKVAVEAALGVRPAVEVFGCDYPTPDGTGVRDYIHVTDLAEAHVAVLEAMLAGEDVPAVLNCGYGKGFSVLEVLDALERVTARRVTRRIRPRRPGDPAAMVADAGRLRRAVGWAPRFDDLSIILRHALDFERCAGAAPACMPADETRRRAGMAEG